MEIRTVDSFLTYFERVRFRTQRVVDRIPPDRIDWSPLSGKWTFADLVRHLAATERFMFVENAWQRPSRYPGHGPDLADGYHDVMSYFRELHETSLDLLRQLSDDDLARKCITPGGTSITVWKWLRAMVEHEVHHRGQIYLMLGMLGIGTPPLYGLTSEEVRARSRPAEESRE